MEDQAWYEGAFSKIGELWDSATDYVGELGQEYLGAKAEQTREGIRSDLVTNTQQSPTAPYQYQQTAPQPGGVNWTKWGVIIGGIGVALTLYKLSKG